MKLYNVRKECFICKQVFYPNYSGAIYVTLAKTNLSLQTTKAGLENATSKV